MKLIRFIFLLAISSWLFSCAPQKKIPYYLDNVVDSSGHGNVGLTELRIQKNDMLSITIYSAAAKEGVDEFYNTLAGGAAGTPGSAGSGGVLVDSKGNIEFPRVGTFHAEGLTKDELAAQIRKRLVEPVELLKDPTVIIRFLNLKVTVLGEVSNQGMISIPGERLTILEALGLAGGITEYGIKNNVKVMRELDGKRQIGIVNLSSDSLFISPYYNLVQNDVVVVSPTRQRQRQADAAQSAQRISLALSIITAAAFIANFFR